MGTILVYRNDGDQPYAEVALDNGDTVQLRLNRGGAAIERQAPAGGQAELLFQAKPEVVSDLCLLLMGGKMSPKAQPLDLLASIIMQMRSAEDVRAAFKQAVTAL
jgi:hypothetical protein